MFCQRIGPLCWLVPFLRKDCLTLLLSKSFLLPINCIWCVQFQLLLFMVAVSEREGGALCGLVEKSPSKRIFEIRIVLNRQQMKFKHLRTSYLRLATHCIAEHYSLQSMVPLDNNVPDGSGSSIIIIHNIPLIHLAGIPVNLPSEASSAITLLSAEAMERFYDFKSI